MPKTQSLSVDLPRIDAGTQSRIAINDDVVGDYAEIIEEAGTEWPFPPLDVFHDGTDYYVADGFHRLLGARRTKRGSIPCIVHKGTATDARIFAMTANDQHGMRMTRADKRACVEWLLKNGGKMTQAAIAAAAGVTPRTVKMIVADQNPVSIAGKASPPKQDSKGKTSPSTPIRGDSDRSDPAPVAAVGPSGSAGDDVSSADPFDEAPESPETAPEPETASKSPRPPKARQRAAQDAEGVNYGKCPNCAGTKWTEDEDGVCCSKCYHPHGEPAGDVDEDRIKTQRQKTVKTVEALMRAFDDLQMMLAKPEHEEIIGLCKVLLKKAKEWK